MKIKHASFMMQRSYKRPKKSATRGTKKLRCMVGSSISPEEPVSLVKKTVLQEVQAQCDDWNDLSLTEKMRKEPEPTKSHIIRKFEERREERWNRVELPKDDDIPF